MLLERGAEVNAIDSNGDSALSLAASRCLREVYLIRVLLKAGELLQKSVIEFKRGVDKLEEVEADIRTALARAAQAD